MTHLPPTDRQTEDQVDIDGLKKEEEKEEVKKERGKGGGRE